jgi:hypothetical protein
VRPWRARWTWRAPLLLALAGTAAAAPLESPRQSWVIDHTRTEIGGEFFRAFASAWRAEERGAVVISVEEQMGPAFAHQIRIWVGSRLLLQTQLHPGQRNRLAGVAQGSAAAAAERLRRWQSPTEVML